MNKQILLTMFLVLAVIFSVSVISASEVNVTDSYATNLVDDTSDVPVPLEKTADSSEISVSSDSNVDNDSSKVSLSSEEVLGSENSNTLSTITYSNDSVNGVISQSVSSNGVYGAANNVSSTVNIADTIKSCNVTKFYNGSTKYTATFSDNGGNVLSDMDVKIIVNGETKIVKTDSNGVASLEINLKPGNYEIIAINPITGFQLTTAFRILSTIQARDVSKVYTDALKFTATFLNSNGEALTNETIKFKINGMTYSVKTNNYGVASLSLAGLKDGNYEIISYNIDGLTKTNKINIVSSAASILAASNEDVLGAKKLLSTGTVNEMANTTLKWSSGTFDYGSQTFKVRLLDSNGNALGKKTVKLTIGSKSYSATTGATGYATFKLTLTEGKYSAVFKYAGDSVNGACSLSKDITINGKPNAVLNWSSGTFDYGSQTFKVRLLDSNGNALGKKTVKLAIGSKSYSATTGATGYATFKLTLTEGKYSAVFKYGGDSVNGPCNLTKEVTIGGKPNAVLNWSSGTFDYGSQTFKVLLSDSKGNPLAEKTVKLAIGSKSYSATTVVSGYATFKLALTEGKYSAVFTFDGDSLNGPCSLTKDVTITGRTSTVLVWSSGTFDYGSQTFKVLLLDSNGNALSGKTVKLTIDSKSYSTTTVLSGYAIFNLNLAAGNYTAVFKYDGDNSYSPSSLSKSVTISKPESLNGYGYWLFAYEMDSVNFNTLASKGVTDLFLNYYAVSNYGKSTVESFIASARKVGINVHIWIQAFYDGDWVNPVKNGAPNTDYFNKIINQAKTAASLKGVTGVHFDYLRYPGDAYKTSGGTDAITQFAKSAAQAIRNIDSKLIVSCAVMPETDYNKYYYGQDIPALSSIMDVIIPMVYKGNYNAKSSWITSTISWFVKNSNGAKIWAGVQSYKKDGDYTRLSVSELTNDVQAGINGGATGGIIFRLGISNMVDFNSIKSGSSGPDSDAISIKSILDVATTLKNTIASTGEIPKNVTVDGVSYTTPQFLYIMSQAILLINSGVTTGEVSPISVDYPENSTGDAEGQLNSDAYIDVVSRIVTFIDDYQQAPNYASSDLGKISYDQLVDAFSRILAFYQLNSQLPNYVAIKEVAPSVDPTPTPTPTPDPTPTPTPTGKTITVQDILTGSTNLKEYIAKNGELPNTVTTGGITFKTPEFLYLMSQAIYQIGNSNFTDVSYIIGVDAAENPYGDPIYSQQLSKENYITVANNVAKFIIENNLAPNFASSTLGKISYNELIDSFSRVLAYYNSNKEMPNYVVITQGSDDGGDISPSGYGTGLNEKNTVSDVSIYLKSTTNCQVGNSAIKSIVDSVTAGLTTDAAKAKAIYNYVRDAVSYSFYYNTRYGAVGTLNAKTGNCVDQAHLVIAMFRTAGLAARYVHGTCRFSDGTFGHVWSQVLIDGTWYVADCTSPRNSLGVVNNWNTNSFSLNGIYSGISF